MEDPSSSANVNGCLLDVRDKLSEPDERALKDALQRLEASGSAPNILQLLVPSLFRPDESTSEGFLSNQDALSILGLLVAHDSSKYLEPASVAVRKESIRLAAAADEPMVVMPQLLAVITQQLTSGMTGVSTQAEQTLVACSRKLGVEHVGAAALESLVDAWRRAWKGDALVDSTRAGASTVCVRCASCIAEIASLGDDFMRLAISSGGMNLILQLIGDESDVLLEMASLDIVEKLITTRPMHDERAQWLYSEPVLLPLLEMAGGAEETVPDPVLGGQALRVLSQLCKLGHTDSHLFTRAGDYLLRGFHQALHNFDVSGELDRLAKIDAISSFASAAPDALQLVLDDPETRHAWLSLSVAQPKLKAVVLHSVAMVLDPVVEVDANGDTVMGTSSVDDESGRRLYFTLGQVNNDEPTTLVLAFTRSPLPEVRLGAYALLTAVAKLPTGPQILLGDATFLEFLLSRPPHENTMEGREAKYKLVESICNSSVKGLLAENIIQRLDKYLKQGAHFVETVTWELATEG